LGFSLEMRGRHDGLSVGARALEEVARAEFAADAHGGEHRAGAAKLRQRRHAARHGNGEPLALGGRHRIAPRDHLAAQPLLLLGGPGRASHGRYSSWLRAGEFGILGISIKEELE
jgi:hypothetical protein